MTTGSIGRRGLIVGVACAAAAAAANSLIPRRHLSLLGSAQLTDIVPAQLPKWAGRDVNNLVGAATEDDLAAKLYSQTVTRIYAHRDTGDEVMMLLAYGPTQSNELQLHRPEVCYPAFGFKIVRNDPATVPLAQGAVVPARDMVCDAGTRRENITYWTRLGEYLPNSGSQQRWDRVRTATQGVVADGVLARFSVIDAEPAASFVLLRQFIPDLIRATTAAGRAALLGTQIAKVLAADRV